MTDSLIDRYRKTKRAKKLLSEQQREKAREQIIHGEFMAAKQKEYYKIQAETAIRKAQNAHARNDAVGRSSAMNELKLAYGVYHYMTSLYDAYRVMESQLQLQTLTQEFSDAVDGLSRIRVNSPQVNFAGLTKKAMGNFFTFDTEGLNSMLSDLMRGSISATESQYTDDAFLESLVSGEVSLDAPYPSKTLEEMEEKSAAGRMQAQVEPAQSGGNLEEIWKLLDQIATGMSGN